MKIFIADFEIMKYGGIVEHVESKVKAFKHLGHDIDIIQISPTSTKQKAYDKSLIELADGSFESKQKINSQNGGYEISEATGYWKNNYYGYYLPPTNKIGIYEPDALERWNEIVKDADLILWNFVPTKSSVWSHKDTSFWWKFFDLPSKIKQVFIVHDAYFDIRASNVSALHEKILYLECAHIAAYQCCENIDMPRVLLLNPRYLDENSKMPVVLLKDRKEDFFAAHIFKSMKRVEDLLRAVPYMNYDVIQGTYSITVAGSGIEQAYMTSPDKVKENYICDIRYDPDLPEEYDKKITVWNRAEKFGMHYIGLVSSVEVTRRLQCTKFAVDPSWARHYAQYCRTHINGFIIEAMLNGCYPVLRDYRGLEKSTKEIYDPLFENIRAVIIPWNATPKEFAEALKKAEREITQKQYLIDTKHNFDLVMELFNAVKNAEETIRLIKGGKKLVNKELRRGEDSDTVTRVTREIMEDFFGIHLPIEFETE